MQNLKSTIQNLKSTGFKIVLVTGVFDVLHQEHHRFLKKAKAAGDFLLVGIESDQRVKELKGPDRPINSATKRVYNLASLPFVDQTFLLPEKFSSPADHDRLIAAIKPDILAVSSHTSHQPEKLRILNKYGGRVVVVHDHNPAISTTKLLKKPPAGS